MLENSAKGSKNCQKTPQTVSGFFTEKYGKMSKKIAIEEKLRNNNKKAKMQEKQRDELILDFSGQNEKLLKTVKSDGQVSCNEKEGQST
jgi:hypothetical protein